jgi:hypothetical protein
MKKAHTATAQMNLETLELRKRRQPQKITQLQCHLYEISTTDKSIGTESDWFTGSWGRGAEELLLMGTRFPFGETRIS